MTGRAMMGNIMVNGMMNEGLSLEIIYSFVIILASLMIYYGTKELYELSGHKGIKYFRQAFLYFALAYFFRSSIKFALRYFNVMAVFDIDPRSINSIIGQTTLFLYIYLSTMAIFYLLLSVKYKQWKNESVMFLQTLAVIVGIISVIYNNPLSHLVINLGLLVVVVGVVILSKSGKKNNLQIIYILLLLFWVLNVLDVMIPGFFRTFQLIIYLASSGIFMTMLYRVLRNTGGK